jgi:hypothetical protein
LNRARSRSTARLLITLKALMNEQLERVLNELNERHVP